MSPAYPEHAGPITRLNALLVPALVSRADVRETYRAESRFDLGDTLSLAAFPDVTVAVADVFA